MEQWDPREAAKRAFREWKIIFGGTMIPAVWRHARNMVKDANETMNWLIWLFGVPGPFVIGFLWGAWRGRRDSFAPVVLLLAPIVSGVVVCGAMFATNLALGERNPRDTMLGLAVAFVIYGGIYVLIGMVPALLGCAAGQLGKIWLIRRNEGLRQSENAEQNPVKPGG
ncbi:MAG: hypothetical protein AB7O62_11740 [Pirellulales bacterium]